MALHELKAMFSHQTEVSLQEQILEGEGAAQASAVPTSTAIPPGRRCEARTEYRHMCSYEVLEPLEAGMVVIEQGEVFTLNRSTEGILLLMGQAPHAKHLIKVQSPRSQRGRTANVFEARWAKPVQVESLGSLYLVGCRRVLAPVTIVRSDNAR